MDYQKLAASIIQNVGGVDNVILLTHCMTRLRFNLKDSNLVNKTALEDLKGVVGVIYAGGQYMIILGKNLLPVYESITKNFAVKTGAAVSENLDNTAKEPLTWKNVGNKIVGFVSAAVTPIVPGLVAGGMLKVVILLIVTFIDPAFNKTTSYQLISAIADAPFYFMPVLVAYGAANKLGATPVYAMVATAALLHHNFIDLV
ncbi:MAG: PTS transporter subunit EIIB, partial [Lactobacillaceae bacterium]